MPALPVVPGVVRIHFFHTVGTDASTGYGLYMEVGPTPPTQAQANTWCTQTVTAWSTYLAALTSADVRLNQVTMTDLSGATGVQGSAAGSAVGSRAGGRLSANACVLVNQQIARRYRGGKPRHYIPAGVTTDTLDPQHWASAFLTSFQTQWTSFQGNMISNVSSWASGAAWVNVSYYHGFLWKQDVQGNWHRVPTPRATPVIDPIQSFSVNPIIGSQRRRLRPT